MLAEGSKATPLAALSRPVAGVMGSTLLVTLPGSPKAVKECVAALTPLLPHALFLLGDQPHGHHKAPSSACTTPAAVEGAVATAIDSEEKAGADSSTLTTIEQDGVCTVYVAPATTPGKHVC